MTLRPNFKRKIPWKRKRKLHKRASKRKSRLMKAENATIIGIEVDARLKIDRKLASEAVVAIRITRAIVDVEVREIPMRHSAAAIKHIAMVKKMNVILTEVAIRIQTMPTEVAIKIQMIPTEAAIKIQTMPTEVVKVEVVGNVEAISVVEAAIAMIINVRKLTLTMPTPLKIHCLAKTLRTGMMTPTNSRLNLETQIVVAEAGPEAGAATTTRTIRRT